jgi:ParB-like nuclease domain
MPESNTPAKPHSGPEFRKVETEKVRFDPKNPRLGVSSITDQPKLQAILMGEPHFANLLLESFLANGFIEYEPLVVRQSNDNYVVIEGNRRLAAVKHILSHADQYPKAIVKELKEVPVLIFHQKADSTHQREIRTYLGVRHLLGYREWPAESKAIFLDQNIRTKADLKKLKSEFAIGQKDIARYLVPYRVRKAANELLDDLDSGEDQSFWILGEALQRAGIKQYIKLDVDPTSFKIRDFDRTKLQYLLEFLYGSTKQGGHGSSRAAGMRRITDTRQLSRLANVLSIKRASERLENGSTLEEAELYVSTPEETIDGLIAELLVIFQKIIALQPTDAQLNSIESHVTSFKKAMKSQ